MDNSWPSRPSAAPADPAQWQAGAGVVGRGYVADCRPRKGYPVETDEPRYWVLYQWTAVARGVLRACHGWESRVEYAAYVCLT